MKNKIAFITGAARGIGKVIALFLAKEGANVILNDIDEEAGQKASQEIQRKTGAKVSFIKANITREKEVKDIVSVIEKEFTNLHILVNNAGILSQEGIEETNLHLWQKVLEINLTGTFICTKFAIPLMKKQRYGHIINISSVAGECGGLNVGVAYASSKAGILGFTKSLAKDLAPFNITVNAVAPSLIETCMGKVFTPQQRQQIINQTPLGRLGKPEDVAFAVSFLASEKAGFITGEIIDVNGGLFIN